MDFQLPNVYFDRRFTYKVRCRHIHLVESDEEAKIVRERYTLLALTSNLVDLSSSNPIQMIGHFWRRPTSPKIAFSQLTDGALYSLQLYELENATFKVIDAFTGRKIQQENIFIQLEIIKSDPYGRLQ